MIYDDVDHDFQIGFFLVIDFLIENLTKIFLDFEVQGVVTKYALYVYLGSSASSR